jgi:hypothetical protein
MGAPPVPIVGPERFLRSLPAFKKNMPSKYTPSAPPNRNAPVSGSAPVKTLRLGRIKAAIWENGADQRAFFNVTFARTYMDEEKKFHDTDNFGRDDLLLLAKLADQAHTFICDRLSTQKPDESPEGQRRG